MIEMSGERFVDPVNKHMEQKLPIQQWLKDVSDNPEYLPLVLQAKRPHRSHLKKYIKPEQSKLIKLLKDIGLVVEARDLYGKSLVTDNLKKSAKNTAMIMSISAIINGAFVLPVLYYSFSFLGFLPGFLASALSGYGISAFSNYTVALATSNSKGNELISGIAGAAYLSMSLALTVASGVGAELFNNQTELAQIVASEKADLFIQEKQASLNNNPHKAQLKVVSQKCTEGKEKLRGLEEGTMERNDLFLELWGPWGAYENSNLEDNVTSEDLDNIAYQPICVQERTYLKKSNKYEQEARTKFVETQENRIQLGNDVEFLSIEAEKIHSQFFTKDGHLKDGALAVKVALENLIDKTVDGRWNELGFSIFLLLISAITSITACALAFLLASSDDAIKSNCPTIKKEIEEALNDIKYALYLEQELEKAKLGIDQK
jgi:hypothetical protein